VLTPHLGYVTMENYREMYTQAVEDIHAFIGGKPLRVIAPQG
jgi:phosphoglycerate dehydrogenase-like enzyme